MPEELKVSDLSGAQADAWGLAFFGRKESNALVLHGRTADL